MQVMTAYRYRLDPTPEQRGFCVRTAGACRALYNAALDQRNFSYQISRRCRPTPGRFAQDAELKELKRVPGLEWLAEAPHHCLQQTLGDLDRAFANFFKGFADHPSFHKKFVNDSFRFPDAAQIKLLPSRHGWVFLPKLKWVRFHQSRQLPIEGRLCSATVSREGEHWYVSFQCQVEIADPICPSGNTVGIDLGITNSIALSSGEVIRLPKFGKREQEKLAILDRRVASKQKGSANRRKALVKRHAYYRHLASRRKDAQHKATTLLAKSHGELVIEDLRVRKMTASAKGTVEAPGTNVAQKAGLNRSLLNEAFGEFRRQLTYKCAWYGSGLTIVPAMNSSRECSACGHTEAGNRPSRDEFRCLACGHEAPADWNAAETIKNRAQRGERLVLAAPTALPTVGTTEHRAGTPGVRLDEADRLGQEMPPAKAA